MFSTLTSDLGDETQPSLSDLLDNTNLAVLDTSSSRALIRKDLEEL